MGEGGHPQRAASVDILHRANQDERFVVNNLQLELWVTNDKTHLEHNESVLTLKADLATVINDFPFGPKQRHGGCRARKEKPLEGGFISSEMYA